MEESYYEQLWVFAGAAAADSKVWEQSLFSWKNIYHIFMVKSLINYKVQSLPSLVLGLLSKWSVYDLCLLNRNLLLCGIIIWIKSIPLYILYRKSRAGRWAFTFTACIWFIRHCILSLGEGRSAEACSRECKVLRLVFFFFFWLPPFCYLQEMFCTHVSK